MAQLSGLLLEASLTSKYGKSAKAVLTVLERTKFRSLVKPGDTLTYHAEVLSVNDARGKVKARALREGAPVTSTEMVFAFKYVDDPQLDEKRRRLMETWMSSVPGAPPSPPVTPVTPAFLPATLGAPASLPANSTEGSGTSPGTSQGEAA